MTTLNRLQRTTELLGELIAFPTVSRDSNRACIDWLADRLDAAGARVEVLPSADGAKANLFATLGPDIDGGIVLCGHTDVVPVDEQDWHSDPFTMVERDGRLFGRGSCDMKGFIATCLAMAPNFAARVRERPLHFAFTFDEEVGCLGARALVDVLRERGLRPGIAIIGEPTEMRLVEGHKGCCEYTVHFEGLPGHGSDPAAGVNAVEFASRYVARLLGLRDQLQNRAPADSPFQPPWSTLNVGALHGGTTHNVIASRAQLDWEMRPVQGADADFVKADLRDYCERELLPAMRAVHPAADIRTEVIGEVVGLVPMGNNEARALVAELTAQDAADTAPFGTEAGLFQSLGTSAVVCGPGSIAQAHKADEYVEIAQLARCLDMLAGLADRL